MAKKSYLRAPDVVASGRHERVTTRRSRVSSFCHEDFCHRFVTKAVRGDVSRARDTTRTIWMTSLAGIYSEEYGTDRQESRCGFQIVAPT